MNNNLKLRRDFPLYAALIYILIVAIYWPANDFILPQIKIVTFYISDKLPAITRYAEVSTSPIVTQIILSQSLLLSWIIATWYVFWQAKYQNYEKFRENKKLMAWGWIFLPLALFPIYLPPPAIATTYRAASLDYIAVRSRMGTAIFGSVWLCGELLFIAIFTIWILSFTGKKSNS